MSYYEKKTYTVLLVLISALMLSGYTKKETDEQTITDPSPVHVKTYKMTAKESSKAFGKNLISHKYQPIELTIYNDSDELLFFRASSINLPLENATTILEATRYPALITTCTTTTLSALYFWPAIIPSIGLGIWMSRRNRYIEKKVRESILEPNMAFEIFPYEQVTKTFFVKTKMLPECFSIHFFNPHQKAFLPYTFSF